MPRAQMVLKKNPQPCFVLQDHREGAAWWNFTKWHNFQSNVAALKSDAEPDLLTTTKN